MRKVSKENHLQSGPIQFSNFTTSARALTLLTFSHHSASADLEKHFDLFKKLHIKYNTDVVWTFCSLCHFCTHILFSGSNMISQ